MDMHGCRKLRMFWKGIKVIIDEELVLEEN